MADLQVLLAHNYNPEKHDVSGWWASEKLDGMRAYWDGKSLLSRNGNLIYAPAWFTQALPPGAEVDGELFMGRKMFQKTISIVRKHDAGPEWRKIQYHIFDIPSLDYPFEKRYQTVKNVASMGKHFVSVVQEMVKDHESLMHIARKIWNTGGEGIMLRQPGSLYERKRSNTLLKVKDVQDDIAVVIGHEPGKGKHKGRLGALVCKIGTVQFNVGTGFSDADREKPPGIGEQVKFLYTELTDAGVPRFPRYLCVHKGD